MGYSQAVDVSKYRTISGRYNNLFNPEWGAAGDNLQRMTAVGYADGISAPGGVDRPNPRVISNTVFAQEGLINDPLSLSDFCWAFGQFIDHDIAFTPDGPEDAAIPVPAGDPHFDPLGEGRAIIPMHRNVFDPTTGTGTDNPRQHPNTITAFIDGSAVYGSSEERMIWLRTFEGGKLKVSADNLLPYNTLTGEIDDEIDPTVPHMDNPVRKTDKIFVAGDARANENPLLLAFHTLFVREHNRLCDELIEVHPDWTDEELYQHARKMVGGIIQAIVYNEWLPAMGVALPPYAGYNANVNPQLSNLFSAAAFRLGHTLLNSTLRRMNNDGRILPGANILLRDAFFDPTWVSNSESIDLFFKGMATQAQQMMDPKVIDDVRNFLFGRPGAGGLDLASININRGRERGLPDFNTARQSFGLPAYNSIAEISSRPEVVEALSVLYDDNVNNIDVWVGLLAEQPMPGALFGETIMAIMNHQFAVLRDGDRFYFENDPLLSEEEKELIRRTTMQDVLMRNTGIKLMQGNVFKSMPHTDICDNLMVDVYGKVRTEDGRPLRSVSMVLEHGEQAEQMLTDAEGAFLFPPVPGCKVKGLELFKEDNVHNGVTTVDLILVTKHILGAKALDSPYKIIAADVDNSQSISVIDLVRLRKVILSVYDAFPNNTAWRFIPSNFEFTNPADPFMDELPDGMSFELLGGDLDQEFIAIKVGDVNGTVSLDAEQRAAPAGDAQMALLVQDRPVRPGELVEIVITSPDIEDVSGFQFALDYDETALEFEDLERGELRDQSAEGNFAVFDYDGVITTSWNRPEEEAASSDEDGPVVFRSRFRAIRAGRISDFIRLTNDFTEAESYDENLNVQQVALNFTESAVSPDDVITGSFELFQNQPNPVVFETVIPFHLPEAGNATIYITDLNGRTIYTQTDAFAAGENRWRLDRSVLQQAGAYFYTVATEFGRSTKKLLVVDR